MFPLEGKKLCERSVRTKVRVVRAREARGCLSPPCLSSPPRSSKPIDMTCSGSNTWCTCQNINRRRPGRSAQGGGAFPGTVSAGDGRGTAGRPGHQRHPLDAARHLAQRRRGGGGGGGAREEEEERGGGGERKGSTSLGFSAVNGFK